MPKLPKYTLTYDDRKGRWDLKKDKTQVVKTFRTKHQATKGGVLKRAVGPTGGSVKIKKQNRKLQEERTYPRSKDPVELVLTEKSLILFRSHFACLGAFGNLKQVALG